MTDDRERLDCRVLESMTSAIVHRDPDRHGTHSDEAVQLGRSRLSILDPPDAGTKPTAVDANADNPLADIVGLNLSDGATVQLLIRRE